MKGIKILAKLAQYGWAYFISSLFTASTYNMKGNSFCLICLDFSFCGLPEPPYMKTS